MRQSVHVLACFDKLSALTKLSLFYSEQITDMHVLTCLEKLSCQITDINVLACFEELQPFLEFIGVRADHKHQCVYRYLYIYVILGMKHYIGKI